ncbi:MAG: CopD family protein [Actinobacteria bacterium]|nr:CopD family protein [Actinomycetota bacterium]
MGSATSSILRARRLATWLLLALATVAAFAAVTSIGAPVARADNTLVNSSPANNDTLAASPTSMTFTFAEPLGPTNVPIAACNGEVFPVGDPSLSADRLTATVPVPNPFPKGTCNVVMNVSAPDSSANGAVSITFTVTADAAVVVTPAPTADTATADTAVSEPAVTAATLAPVVDPVTGEVVGGAAETDANRVGGPLGLARLVAALSLAVLFGSLILIVVAWPEGVEYILTVRFLRTTWAVAIFSSVCVAILLTAQTTGSSVGASLSPTAWIDLKDSAPGLAALARVAFAGGCGWVVLRPERCLEQQSQMMALGIPALAVATFGFSRSGGDMALVGYAAGVVHALAMAVWLGGVVLLTRVVLAGPGEDDLVHAVRGFSRLSTPALLLTVITGAIQTWRLDRGALFDTSHGRVLLVKALAVGVMVFVGLATRQFVSTRLRKADSMTAPMASRLRRATSVEAAGGLFVLMLTAWMLSFTPAGLVDTGDGIDYAYDQGRFVMEDAGADLTVFLTGGVGANGVRVEIDAPATGVSAVQITFRPPDDTIAPTVILTLPPEVTGSDAGAAVLPQAEGVPLLMAGIWTLEVSVTTSTGTQTLQKTFNVE